LGRNAILPIVNATAASLALVFLLVIVGVARLRSMRLDHARPYRVPGGTSFLYVGAVFAFGVFALAMYAPLGSAEGGIPLEWTALIVWVLLGGVFWHLASRMRHRVSEEDRRWLILNEGDLVQTRDTSAKVAGEGPG
jgi:amino acid transporter